RRAHLAGLCAGRTGGCGSSCHEGGKMKGFFWNYDSIGWYRRASEYGDFHERLAELLFSDIDPCESICDMGCGLGYLALELAEHVKHVTAVDIDSAPLLVLRENIRLQNRRNIQVLESDCAALPVGEIWDTMILCFFGRITEKGNLERYLAHCSRRLMFVVSNGCGSNFSSSAVKRPGRERVPEVEHFLQEKGIAYTLKTGELEFGQPMDSVEEAERFTEHYSPGSSQEQIKEHVERRIIPLPNGKYYLSGLKQFGIFIIEK
ncbi:MAG: class I SAM-dependent methyltransferase, partial [Anaerovorax sp.]